ncbi:unannotated protein [freshwater metagenome]|uniref:Unannotated protein n=1 Tax=freshwater metagenome TaxID=449393 RepID=A0A6J6C9C9_9ZZZZ
MEAQASAPLVPSLPVEQFPSLPIRQELGKFFWVGRPPKPLIKVI